MTKNITIGVSDELARKIETMPDVNWSEVCRSGISSYIQERSPQKGEMIVEFERVLRASLRPSQYENQEVLRDTELKRFTRRWGNPKVKNDPANVDVGSISLEKRIKVELGNYFFELWVVNGSTANSLKSDSATRPYKAEEWCFATYAADYFLSRDFQVKEIPLRFDYFRELITNGDITKAQGLWNNASGSGLEYWALIAYDDKDLVYIANRKAARGH